MRKLDIHNKARLVHYAIQKKIIRLPELVMMCCVRGATRVSRDTKPRLTRLKNQSLALWPLFCISPSRSERRLWKVF